MPCLTAEVRRDCRVLHNKRQVRHFEINEVLFKYDQPLLRGELDIFETFRKAANPEKLSQ